MGDGVWIEPPFFCDYGVHVTIGAETFLNVNCVLPSVIDTAANRKAMRPAVQQEFRDNFQKIREMQQESPGGFSGFRPASAPAFVSARSAFASVDDYLAALTPDQRRWLDDLRATIRAVLPPDATEEISYQIVAFKVRGKAVIWYAAFAGHYSLYPRTDGLVAALGERLAPHISGKGTLRFAADQPVPRDLVRDVAAALLAERLASD